MEDIKEKLEKIKYMLSEVSNDCCIEIRDRDVFDEVNEFISNCIETIGYIESRLE